MPHEFESDVVPEGTAKTIRIDTEVWERRDDGYLHKIRVKTVREVINEIRAVVGPNPPGAEEYLASPVTAAGDGDREWPPGRIAVFAVTGGSEGHYVHVQVLHDHPDCVLLGKTFQGRDAAWAFARRLADLLEV